MADQLCRFGDPVPCVVDAAEKAGYKLQLFTKIRDSQCVRCRTNVLMGFTDRLWCQSRVKPSAKEVLLLSKGPSAGETDLAK